MNFATKKCYEACALRFCVIGQINPRLGLAVTDPLGKEPDSRLKITLADRQDGNAGNTHGTRLAYARRHPLMPR